MFVATHVSVSEAFADALDHAADRLRHAGCVRDLAEAIDDTLGVWTSLEDRARAGDGLPVAVLGKITASAGYVIDATTRCGRIAPDDATLEGIIRTNTATAALLRQARH